MVQAFRLGNPRIRDMVSTSKMTLKTKASLLEVMSMMGLLL